MFGSEPTGEIDQTQVADTKATSLVLAGLNESMTGLKWTQGNDDLHLPCIQYKVGNMNEKNDVISQIEELFSGFDLDIEYNDKKNILTIPNYIIAELYKNYRNEKTFLPWPTQYRLGYAGDGRIHGLIEETMNSRELNYEINEHGLCNAYAHLGKNAVHARDLATFKNRLEAFNKWPSCMVYKITEQTKVLPAKMSANFALIRSGKHLFFLNKARNKISMIDISPEQITAFDEAIQPSENIKQLTEQDWHNIKTITDDKLGINKFLESLIASNSHIDSREKSEWLAFFDAIKLYQEKELFEHLFNVCDVLLSDSIPEKESLNQLPIEANFAFVRRGNQLFYINKLESLCMELNLSPENLKLFDSELMPSYEARTLTENELAIAMSIAEYRPNLTNNAAVSELIRSEKLKPIKTFQVDSFTGAYGFGDLYGYLSSLQTAIKRADPPIQEPLTFMMEDINHVICLAYDPKNAPLPWSLININNNEIYSFSDSEQDTVKLLGSLMKGFFQYDNGDTQHQTLVVETKIEGQESEAKAVKAAIQNWKDSDKFKALHAVTEKNSMNQDGYGASWLEVATKFGHTATALALIENISSMPGAAKHLNQADSYYGNTALHYAAFDGNMQVAEKLFEYSPRLAISVNAKNKNKQTPLMIAVLNSNLKLTNLLLSKEADLHITNLNGDTALHLAVRRNDINIVVALIQAGANPFILNQQGKSPLDLANEGGSSKVISEIQNKVNDYNDFMEDVKKGDARAVEIYLKHGWIPASALNEIQDEQEKTLLHWAVIAENEEVIKTLLKYHPDCNAKDKNGVTPLHVAVINTNLLKIFLGKKSELHLMLDLQDERGLTPLHCAVKAGNLEAVITLLENGADPNILDAVEHTALTYAVNAGNSAIVIVLLNHQANPNMQDTIGATPLHYAINARNKNYFNKKVVEALLENKADPNIKEKHGFTPLSLAVMANDKDLAEELIDYGAHPGMIIGLLNELERSAKNKNGKFQDVINLVDSANESYEVIIHKITNPTITDAQDVAEYIEDLSANIINKSFGTPDPQPLLNYAAAAGNVKAINALLENGADPNIANSKGFTPLHYIAATVGISKVDKEKIIKMLLEKGADLFKEDTDGLTPLQIAAEFDNVDFLNILNKFSLNPPSSIDKMQFLRLLYKIEDEHGMTLAHIAAKNASIDFLKRLVELDTSGGLLDLKNRDGKTPEDFANEMGFAKEFKNLCNPLSFANQGPGFFSHAQKSEKNTELEKDSQEENKVNPNKPNG